VASDFCGNKPCHSYASFPLYAENNYPNRLEFIGFIDRPCGVLMLEQALNVSAMTSICECSSSAVDLVSDATQRGRISSAIWHDGHA
jgi:hypothetical protein